MTRQPGGSGFRASRGARGVMRRLAVVAAAVLATAAAAAEDGELAPNPPAALVVIELAQGGGRELQRGSYAVVHYEGWLWDGARPDRRGRKFDSSRERGAPLSIFYSRARVIEGWYQGMKGMKAGDRRLLVVPPALGYGKRTAFGDIAPDSTLIFDVELLDVVPAGAE